jgi:hypothetical protein
VAAAGGRVGAMQRFVNSREHAVQISIYFIIPKSQNLKSLLYELTITYVVALRMCIEVMLTAIDLNYEPMLETDEVNDGIVARCLPTKVKSALSP